MADRVLEERAGFAVLRELRWDRYRIADIWRPEDQPGPRRGRLVDFVFTLDGTTTALEVVRYSLGQTTIDAGHRVSEIERHFRARLDELLADALGTFVIELAYVPEQTARLGRRAVEEAGVAFADACVRAAQARVPDAEIDVPLDQPWLGHASVTFRQSEINHRYLVHHPAGTARHLGPEVDAWIQRVVTTKGTQHLGFAGQAILAVVRTDIVDADDLRLGLERFGGELPWWRVYVLDLDADRAELV